MQNDNLLVPTSVAYAGENAEVRRKDVLEGEFGGRRVKAYSVKNYPAFGEKVSKEEEKSWERLALEVAAVAVVVIASAAIGFLVGGIPGAIIGGACAIGLVAAGVVCKAIYEKSLGHRFLTQIPKQEQVKPDTYKLGRYYDADLRLTSTADEGFEWKKKLIASAEETIELSANFAGGSSFREILQLIDSKMTANQNIKTHLIISVDFVEKADKEMLASLKKKFGARFCCLKTDRHARLAWNPYSQENHVKMLVVDGKYFVSGGTGIHPRLIKEKYDANKDQETPTLAAQTLEQSARDMDIVGESIPLASVMRKQFFNLYNLWEIRTENKMVDNRFFPLQGNSGVCQEFTENEEVLKNVRLKCIVGGPEHRGNNPIVGEYAKRIGKAKKEIRLANWLFNPTKAIKNALTNAKAEGTNKKIVGYTSGESGGYSVIKALQMIPCRKNYVLLDKVYEANTVGQTYHKKVALFDDTHTIIGSFNLGKKSAKFDHEVAFVIKDTRVAKQCREVLEEDGKRSIKLSREHIVNTNFRARVASFFVAPLVENIF